MVNPQWHDRLRQELRERGLPPAYASRLIEELSEHFTDIRQEENLSMEAHSPVEEKLGTPELLATMAQREYARRTFAGRHPIVTFLIGPIPILIVTWFAIVATCALIKGSVTPILPARIDSPTTFEWIVVYGCVLISRFLPFALTAWLFARFGRSAGRPTWGLAACAIVAFFAFTFLIIVHAPSEQYNLSIFMRPEVGLWHWQDRALQALVPLAMGGWTWWRMKFPTKRMPDGELAIAS